MRLDRLRILLAGSIAPDCDAGAAEFAHAIVRELVATLARAGARFTLMPGKLPPLGRHGKPVAFDWEVLAQLSLALNAGISAVAEAGPLVRCITTQKTLAQISGEHRVAWDRLIATANLDLHVVPAGWSSGAIRRARAAENADVLIAIGGGEGVEHLAQEFLRESKPVIPIDIGLNGSCGDGVGGATKILQELLQAKDLFTFYDGASPHAALSRLVLRQPAPSANEVAGHVKSILPLLRAPRAFYVRLLAPDDPNFSAVESYFRQVVDPVIAELGFDKFEMGSTPSRDAWMNTEIFRHLSHCSLTVVDITSLRFNCGIELGYALGKNRRVVVTAREGTRPPFDIDKLKIHFWNGADVMKERGALNGHWSLVRNRGPLVEA